MPPLVHKFTQNNNTENTPSQTHAKIQPDPRQENHTTNPQTTSKKLKNPQKQSPRRPSISNRELKGYN